MHRSGTSMITRVVNILGAYLGEEDEMMPARPDNPAGFWEHQLLYELHERLLSALNRSWDTALPLPADWHSSPEISPFRDELAELIGSRFAGRPLWAWKDPRTCVLLPLWREVLDEMGVELRCLLVTRNPLDVARSLQTRNGFTIDEGYGLWLNHNLAMLQNSSGLARVALSYQEVLDNWQASLEKWAPLVKPDWSPDDSAMLDAMSKVIRTDLCHGSSSLQDLSQSGCPKPVIELAQILDSMAESGHADLPEHANKIESLLIDHLALARLYRHDFARSQGDEAELRRQVTEHEKALSESRSRAQTQEQRVSELEVRLTESEQNLSDSQAKGQGLKQRISALQSELADAKQGLVAARAQRETIEARLQLSEREGADTEARMTDYEKRLTEAELQREALERQLELREREREDAEARATDLERKLADATLQRKTIERQLEIREREVDEAEARVAERERVLAAARVQGQTAERQLELRERQLQNVKAMQEEMEGQLASAQALVEERDRELSEIRSKAREAVDLEELAEARELAAQREAELEQLQSTADEIWMQLESEREQTKTELAARKGEIAKAWGTVEEREAELAELQRQADKIWMQLLEEREIFAAHIEAMRSSHSWRITRPLRVLRRRLRSTRQWLRSAVGRSLAKKRTGIGASFRGTVLATQTGDTPTGGQQPSLAPSTPYSDHPPKVIAFYLPQFHPIPENDAWWGKGFTEWTNVAKAEPFFDGHSQPRRPSDLGYYDLRLPEVREAQAELARAHGIHGFCYHYYWFDGKRVLERPLDDVLRTGSPDFPFCICWANESWSRRWDGSESDILLAQNYKEGFAERFAKDLVPYLEDSRYIRIEDRPLVVVYRIDQIPDLEAVVVTWRQTLRELGIGEVFLGAVECFGMTNPTRFGFDAAIEFPPHNPPPEEHQVSNSQQRRSVAKLNAEFSGTLRDYRVCARSRMAKKLEGYPLFRGVMPSWDNTARTGLRAMIYHHASPQVYQEWLSATLQSAAAFSAPYEPVVFVNAWNEWAENAYLEPDAEHGSDYLRATKTALDSLAARTDGIALGVAARPDRKASPDLSTTPTAMRRLAEVSVIIPAFNQAELTRKCLESLHRHEAAFGFEVLLVDDCSTDETPRLAEEMPWLRYFRREQNGGFGSTCNLGAQQANGKYLVFLNNDTVVRDGWLNALRETFDNWPNAGLVGSKLVLTHGTMQECGCLLFRDGSAANYGRGEDPRDPRYCHAREADYVSGAAMMIPRELFHELDGFDDLYEPAYYEDVDLAMRVRQKDLKVVVNPHAEVLHLEGGTAGTDTAKGIKRYQVINQKKFFERWGKTLSSFPARPQGEPEARKYGPRVLVVDWIVPRPDRDAGSLRMAALLKSLRKLDCQVTLASRDMSCEAGYELDPEKIGIEVLRKPYYKSLERYLKKHGGSFDYVVLSRRDTAALHMDSIERYCGNAKLIFDTVDLHFVREARQAELGESAVSKQELDKMRALELDFIERSDTCIVVSEEEGEVLKQHLPDQDVRVVSIIFDPEPTPRPFAERSGLLFIGAFIHTPNIGAVLWFANEVLPELGRRGFEPVLNVIGSNPPEEVRALHSEQIRIHGFVPDVEPFFDQCRLSIAPVLYGAGVKGKVVQSMALGLPCITTSIGAEGTFIEDGLNGMVADDAVEFASRLEAAYKTEKLWSELREQGLDTVRKYFSSDVATEVLGDLILGTGSADRS
jgi:GT2 family glycosyltransferase/glycosyltransferase involved in cell wall biosynthesis